ncbi:MAG: DNA polymerase III subunit beta [Spirochaetia bacterium]|nr:DNA polymerase III subunit beta [Spirochaetia bacterium]
MKFICNKNSILNEISIAQGIISSRNTMSILSNVLLEVFDGNLYIKATDLKIGYETSIPVAVEEEGSTTVYCDKFSGVIKTFPDGDIKFTLKDDKLVIESENGDSKAQLKVIGADKYPELCKIEDEKYFEISQKDFIEMINNTSFAVSSDETKYFMNGIFFEKGEGCIKMVATDGRRLSLIKKDISLDGIDFKSIIIPVKVLQLIKKLSSGEGNFKIAISDKCFFAKFDKNKIYSTLIEGNFPNYQRVIPDNPKFTAILNRNSFMMALTRVSIFAEQKAKKIFFDFSEDNLVISSEETDIGTATVKVPCEYKGDDMKIAVNYVHFMDPLKVISENDVAIRFSEANRAMTLNSVPENEFLHIMMPMQL